MLKPIGLWIQTLADEDFPAPQELAGELPNETRAALVQYLATGLPLIKYRGYSWCRFDCGIEHSRMGRWDLTDGLWVWPEGLSQYAEVPGIRRHGGPVVSRCRTSIDTRGSGVERVMTPYLEALVA